MSTRLSNNFYSHEFRCSCGCGSEEVHPDLVKLLQGIRDAVGEGIKVTSDNRCKSHNESIPGAAKNAWHVPRPNP